MGDRERRAMEVVPVAVAMATLEKEQVVTEEGAEMTTPMSQTPTQ